MTFFESTVRRQNLEILTETNLLGIMLLEHLPNLRRPLALLPAMVG